MRLSDMFSTLAENARTYEKRVAEWQDEMNSRNDDMMSGARKWQETAMQRQDEMNRQIRGYFDADPDGLARLEAAVESVLKEDGGA